MAESYPNGQKTLWEKEILLVTSNFSFSNCVFNRLVSQGRQKVSLCGNGLSKTRINLSCKRLALIQCRHLGFSLKMHVSRGFLTGELCYLLRAAIEQKKYICCKLSDHTARNFDCRIIRLTLSQTTNFGLFLTEWVCELPFLMWWKWKKVLWMSWKHCGKRRNCSWRAISPFPTVFSRGLFPRGVKRCHCVEMG